MFLKLQTPKGILKILGKYEHITTNTTKLNGNLVVYNNDDTMANLKPKLYFFFYNKTFTHKRKTFTTITRYITNCYTWEN